MHPIAPITLEIFVLLLGIFLLLAESFSKGEDKGWMARTAIFTLVCVFAFSFFTTGNPPTPAESGFWHFYSADAPALFFKRIALLSTIVVLVMALEYQSVLERFTPGEKPGAGIGEFYALPVF